MAGEEPGWVDGEGRLKRVFMGKDTRDMDLAPGDCRSRTGNRTRQPLLDLVDRPQEARGGSVLVPAKADNRSAGFCQEEYLSRS